MSDEAATPTEAKTPKVRSEKAEQKRTARIEQRKATKKDAKATKKAAATTGE